VPKVSISRLEEKSDGHILAVSSAGWLELDGLKPIEHPGVNERLGAAWNEVFHVFEDRNGDLWFCSRQGLARKRGDDITRVPRYGTAGHYAFRIIEDAQGNLWAFTQGGLFRASVNGLEPLALAMNAASAFGDRDGNLWVGRKGDGLVRFKDRSVQMFQPLPGPSTDRPMTVLARADGKLWVGNACGGLALFNGRDFESRYSEKDGLTNSCVWSIAEDQAGDLWLGTYGGGLFRFRSGAFQQFAKPQGLPGNVVRVVLPAADGSLWIGTEDGLSHMRDGIFRNYTMADGLASNRVLNLYRDRSGTLWVATSRGVDRMEDNRFVHIPSSPDVFGSLYIGLSQDSSGVLYALSAPKGIRRVDGSRLARINEDLDVMSMLEYRKKVWLAGVSGIFRFPAGEISLAPESREGAVDYEQFGIDDGLSSPQASLGVPNMTITPGGRLWVATVHGLAGLDLTHSPGPSLKPLIYADEVTIGRNKQPAGRELILPPGTHHVELHFDSLELSSPEKIRFQYRMDGVDSNWLDADSTRTAVYTSIPNGAHAFHIRACNARGIWDRTGIVYPVTQQPYFYETAWFRSLAVAITLVLLLSAYRFRLQQLERRADERLQDRIVERERIAREIHDTLLQGIQGLILRFQAIAEKLPPGSFSQQAMENDLDRAEQLLMEGRDRVKELRGSVETGRDVFRSLREAGEELARDFPGDFRATLQGEPRDLHPVVAEEIYRLGLEALTNAFHHAEARQIGLALSYTKARLRLEVSDDGQGINSTVLDRGHRPGHYGLIGMRERATRIGAQLEVSSRPGSGTVIALDVAAAIAYAVHSRVSRWL
jgi:signal transduction histidine kinase/streptogramin lyase